MLEDRTWGAYLRILLVAMLITLLNLAPRPHALRQALNQARRDLGQSNLVDAVDQIAQAAIMIPWRTDLPPLAARYALQSNQPLLAIQYLEQPLVANRLVHADLLVLGDAYQQSGDSMMAALIWQQVAELAPSPEIYQRLADFHLFRKDYPAAIEDLRQVLLYQPSNATLNYRIGLLYATVDPDTALTYLAQAGQMDANLYPASQELLRKIRTSRLFEEPAYTFTAAGRVLASLNEWALAEAAFLRATQLRPNYAEAWAFLGEARQHAIEDPHSANTGLSELQIALRLDPTSLSANLLMGIYWERQGDYQLASGYIQTTIDLDPKNPLLRAELANALAQQGNLPAAQASFEEAIQLAPTDPLFYRLLAEFALEHQIQVREIALPAARMAVILAPNDPLSLDLMGRTMIMLEDYHSAQRFLWQALEIQPEYAPAHLHLGMVLVQQGEMERGRQEFDLAETLGSGTSTATQAQRFLAYYYP
jgi:tetratricopeptide (TPR) repeat protein